MNGLVLKPLELAENKLSVFLERFPEYRKTLGLAVAHEEAVPSYLNYQGWQWSDVETHPTKLIRLVTVGSRGSVSRRDRLRTMFYGIGTL